MDTDIITVIATAEREQALRKLFLKETAESLEIAEVNVLLNAPIDGKNESTRELQRKAALNQDSEYNKVRADKNKAERLLIDADYNLTLAQKSWQAAIARNELEIARLKESASRISLETARLNLEAVKLSHNGGNPK